MSHPSTRFSPLGLLVLTSASLAAILLIRHEGPDEANLPARTARTEPPSHYPPSETGVLLAAQLFYDDIPEVRIAACEIARCSAAPVWLAALLVRTLDEVPNVRRAAQAALAAKDLHVPTDPQAKSVSPSRAADGLTVIMDAMRRRSPDFVGLSACELWADTSWLAFPPSSGETCLTCHVGADRKPVAANEQCRSCHAAIHDEWIGSAHAQSLLHVRLPTGEVASGERVCVDFGDLRGLSCTECHSIATGGTTTRGAGTCIHEFIANDPPEQACVGCHADTATEWRAWLGLNAQPHKAVWPPGDLQTSTRDRRNCVDCHMRSASGGDLPHRSHRWSARRDLGLLREGVHVAASIRVDPQAGRSFIATLTNTAGHEYPTGTCRRTVELLIAKPSGESWLPIARLGRIYPARPFPADLDPPLRPGERRTLVHPLATDANQIYYRLRYVRNRLNPQQYVADIAEGEAVVQP